MEWVTGESANLRLTDLGRALVAGLEGSMTFQSAEPELLAVALEPQDPMIYIHLTRTFSGAGKGMLVDPFLKPEAVQWLLQDTTIRRVLIKSAGGRKELKRDQDEIAIALGALEHGSELEIRHADSKEMHDRCLIADNDTVMVIGSSLSGIGKNVTALIQAPPDIARMYRERNEQLWQRATPLVPHAAPRKSLAP
ncbi:hypothetical protein GCM10009765_32610 [Fodinicola feengrottensis]|uniref:Uncharacterized protein n=2 Tax=Fodinicola feengrottensis TaxID=435914 RepID=A0ABP4T1Y3_9ACTN